MVKEKFKKLKHKDAWEFINNMLERPKNEQQRQLFGLINKLCPNGKKYGSAKTQENQN